MMHYPVAEVVEDGQSLYVRFFKPTRALWYARLKLKLFELFHVGPRQRIVTRIVNQERAEYLLVSYSEWRQRANLAKVEEVAA